MNLDDYRAITADMDPETRNAIGQLVMDALSAGVDRPHPDLVGVGYDRYNRREKEYQEYVKFADEHIIKS